MHYPKCLLLALFFSSNLSISVQAQIVKDGTTNTNLTTTDSGITIDNGNRAGANLFHSFSEFSIPDGSSVTFNNAVEIENIFSRVTGGSISNINGAINANGGANLLLINPAGIVFGENASLNIGGSFFATTADTLLFESGEFSAVNSQAAPLLTINRPIGLNFDNNAEDIVNRANSGQSRTATFEQGDRIEDVTINTPVGLKVDPGENITLIGGNILIDGGGLTAPGGRVELGGLSAAGEVTIDADNTIGFPDGVAKANLSLTDDAEVDVSGDGSGAIAINVNNLVLSEGSELFAGIAEGAESNNLQTGDITIDADESVRLIGNAIDIEGLDTVISNHVGLSAIKRENPDADSSAIGDSGSIFIQTDRLELSDRAVISTITFGEGEAGAITIAAEDKIGISGGSVIDALSENNFDSGNVDLQTNTLELSTGGKIVAGSDGDGNAGNINLSIDENIIVNNGNPPEGSPFNEPYLRAIEFETGVFANSSSTSTGSGGSIFINADSIEFADRGTFSTSTFSGNGGNIDLQIADTLSLRNSSIISAEASGIGSGGNVNIDSGLIIAFSNRGNGNDIIAKAAAEGAGGNINISTDAILGLQARNATPFNNTNDIDASSQFGLDGTVAINDPDVDPTSGIVELPSVPIDADAILAQDLCRVENETVAGGSSFIVTGRGGLTPTSADSLGKIEQVVNWTDETDVEVSNNGAIAVKKRSPDKLPNKSRLVVQSQGLAVAPDGSLWLTANTGNTMPQNSRTHPDCQT